MQDFHSAGWLGCRSAHPAGLHAADRCSPAPQAACVLEKPRPDAATWCPTRLPSAAKASMPQWPSPDLKTGLQGGVLSVMNGSVFVEVKLEGFIY